MKLTLRSRRVGRAFALCILAVFMTLSGAGNAAAAQPPQKGHAVEELLFRGIKVLMSGQGTSLTVKLASTIRNDRISREAFISHFTITPPIQVSLTRRADGFLLSGDFRPGVTYTVRVRKGLKSLNGAVLKRNQSASVKIPHPEPHVSFLMKGRYVGRSGDLNIPVRMINVRKVFLSLSRVPERNIPIWETYSGWEKRNLEENLAKNVPVTLSPVGKGIFILNLASLLPQGKFGLYLVELRGCLSNKRHRCSRDKLFLVVTDLGLIVKTTPKRVYAWVIHLTDGRPLSGVRVRGYSDRNLFMGEGITNQDGACSFPYNREAVGAPYVVTASYHHDTTYFPLQPTRADTSLFRVGGKNFATTSFLSTFILEKNLYRPGGTLHYATVLRDTKTYRGVALPVVTRFRDPRGRVLITQRGMTDSLGLANFSLPIPKEALTGLYNLELVIGGKVLKTQGIYVEDFVPERVKVTLKPDVPLFTSWGKSGAALNAQYLFGAPVSEGGYRVTWTVSRARKGLYQDYQFGPLQLRGETQKALPSWRQRGTLDREGKAHLLPPGTFPEGNLAPYLLRVKAEVKEAGSERVSRGTTTIPLRLAPLYPGLRLASVTPCQRALVTGVVVGPHGKLLNRDTTLRYTLYRVETRYVLTYSPRGSRRWERLVSRVPLSGPTPLTVLHGKFRVPVEIKRCWNDYLVAVWDPDGGARSELLVPGWKEGVNRPPSPEVLKVSLSTREAAPGEKVTARTVLPFPGRVLWTLELNDVKASHWENAKDKKASFTFTAPSGASTLYVTAYLFQTRPGYLISRAFGISRLRVAPRQVRAPVSVSVPEKIRPETTLKIKIKGPAGGKALVSVVDEGVLQITRFKSPDLYALLLSPFRLSVNTSEGLGWILPRFQLLPGGGAEYAMARMRTRKPRPTFFRSFSFWKVVLIPETGRVEVPVKIPQFEGALRVMVSALGEEGFASSHALAKVASKVVVQPTLPRLLRQGDRVRIPVFLTNTTDKKMETRVQVKAGKQIDTQNLTLAPHGSQTLFFTLHPEAFMGSWPLSVQATYPGGRWHDTFNLTLLPALPKDLISQMFPVSRGAPIALADHLKGLAPQGLRLSVLVSSNPLFGGLRHIKRLMTYPYGCLEQTSSTLLTLTHLLPFLKALAPSEGDMAKIQARVREGVIRLIKLQTSWGGFSFWPGEEEAHAWGSAYATFTLLETREAGFHVPQVVITRAINYLNDLEPNPWRDFVLAKANRFLPSRSGTSRKHRKMTQETLLLKAGTLFYAGYPDKARQVMRQVPGAPLRGRKHKAETFFSPLRLQALKLYMTHLITPKSPKNARLARDLLVQLNQKKDESYYATQGLAWALVALGNYVKSISFSPVKASLTENGQVLPAVSELNGVISWKATGPLTPPLAIQVSQPRKAWVSLTAEGYRLAGFHLVRDKGMVIASRFVTMEGKKAAALHPGDLFILDVALTNTTPGTLRHVAIRVPMVAGLEVVNPRLFKQGNPPWIQATRKFKTRYVDIRDLEVRLFGDLPKGTYHAYLLMRATFRYEGQWPPLRAEVMYRPWVYAIGAQTPLRVQ